MTKVSIITPLFNRAHVLQETADSVFNQSYTDWEWIVVDDGSTDLGPHMVKHWASQDNRIKFHLRNREPKGACTCRNTGAIKSKGEFLIFLDSDDLLAPLCLENRVKYEETCSKKQDVVHYFQTAIFKDNPSEGHLWDDPEHPVSWLEGLLGMKPPCQSTGTMWHRNTWERTGGWNEKLRVWQDIELHMRAHFKGIEFRASDLQSVDFLHRVSSDSISRVGFHSAEKLASRVAVVHYALQHRHHIQTQNEQKALAGMTLSLIRNLSQHSNWHEAESLLERAQSSLQPDEIKLGLKILRFRRWKLDRIPQLRRQIQRQWDETLPSSGRKLGRQRWTSPTP